MGDARLNGAPDPSAARSSRDVSGAAADGVRRVNRAPVILLGVWALTVLVSLPLTLALRAMLADHLGASLAADSAAESVNYDWMQEFADQATGLGVTFKPTIIGFGAVLDNLSAFVDGTPRPMVIVGAATAYVALWIFLAGGIIDRFARDRATRAYGFFSASGVFFFRFLRLAIVQWIVYAALFGLLHGWLFDRVYPRLTHEVTEERAAFFIRLACYIVFGLFVAAATLVFDYAKVRAVVEDRRSMLGAVSAAIGFLRRNAASAVALWLLTFALFAATLVAFGLAAPGAGRSGITMWIGAAVGQLYVIVRLWVKLTFWASETALFQRRLAHAGYVARADPAWPESPAADAIQSER